MQRPSSQRRGPQSAIDDGKAPEALRRGLPRTLALCTSVLAGCADTASWQLPVPETGGAKSALLAGLDGEILVGLEALDLESDPLRGSVLQRTFDQPIDRVELWLYDAPLTELRLDAGLLATQSVPGGEPPKAADAVLTAIFGVSLWTNAEPSPAVQSMRLATNFLCPSVELEEVLLPGIGTGDAFAVALDAESAFVQHRGQSMRYWLDGRLEVSTASIPTTSPPRAGYLAPDGELWLADITGAVVRGDLGRGFTRVPPAMTLPNPRNVIIDGPRSGQLEIDLYIDNSTTAIVQRFDGTGWRVLDTASELVGPAGMIWVGPDELVAYGFGPNPSDFRQITRGQVRPHSVPFESGDAIFSARWVPKFGLVFIGNFGSLVTWKDGQFSSIRGQFNTVADVAPFDDGLIFGGWRDLYNIYLLGNHCLQAASKAVLFRTRIVPVGDAFVLPRRLVEVGERASLGVLRRK